MRVLFLSFWFPYPTDNGARIRVYNLIKALAYKNDVYLVSLLQDEACEEDVEYLSDICSVVSVHRSRWFSPKGLKSTFALFSSIPRSVLCTYDPAVRQSICEAIDRISPDVIVASSLYIAQYIPDGLRIPVVLDEHNCEYALLQRTAQRERTRFKRLRLDMQWRKCARWEAAVCRSCDLVAAVSEEDRRSILSIAPDLKKLCVVPNGVDVDYYDPSMCIPDRVRLLYNGALTYSANLDAVRYYADEIYPILRNELPDLRLQVTGRTTGVDLRGISDCDGVELVGYVNDIRDVLKRSSVCVVPLREGGGSRLKILEAMAAGVPVVATSMGAEGIDAISGEHLLIADDAVSFANAIRLLITDPKLSERLRVAGRALVEAKYSWASIGENFVDVVESAVSGAPDVASGVRSDS